MELIFGAIIFAYLAILWLMVALYLHEGILRIAGAIVRIEPIFLPNWFRSISFWSANALMVGNVVVYGLLALRSWLAA